jgi:hypothetical protein
LNYINRHFSQTKFEYNNRQGSELPFASDHYLTTTISNTAKDILFSTLMVEEQTWSNTNVWIMRDDVCGKRTKFHADLYAPGTVKLGN